MNIVDPIAFFRDGRLEESLVIRLGYSPARQEFELVFAFANIQRLIAEMPSRSTAKALPDQPREFRQLIFLSATKPRRESVSLKRCDPQMIDYALREDSGGGSVIQGVLINKSSRYSIELSFGSFGTYSFEFEELTEHRRTGRAVPAGTNRWDYFDAESNQPFDFYDPFHR